MQRHDASVTLPHQEHALAVDIGLRPQELQCLEGVAHPVIGRGYGVLSVADMRTNPPRRQAVEDQGDKAGLHQMAGMILKRPAHLRVQAVAPVHQDDGRERARPLGGSQRPGQREAGIHLDLDGGTRPGSGLTANGQQHSSNKTGPANSRHATGPGSRSNVSRLTQLPRKPSDGKSILGWMPPALQVPGRDARDAHGPAVRLTVPPHTKKGTAQTDVHAAPGR